MEGTRVSVALCTRNGARYVERQVSSILAQTHPVAEIVLSDDDSSDDTVALVKRTVDAASADARPELVVLRNAPALGIAQNFTRATLHAASPVVAFADQDDIWHTYKVATLLEALDDSALLVHSDARLVDGSGASLGRTLFESLDVGPRELRELAGDLAFACLLRRNLVTGATMMVRRDFVEAAAPVPPGWLHDEWVAILAAARGGTRTVPRSLIDYRQHGANVVGASAPGLRAKARRSLRPLRAHTRLQAQRARYLLERLESLDPPVARDRLDLVHGLLEHESRRSAYPALQIARVPAVLRAEWRGDYRRFGRGALDAARDVLRPA